MIASAVCAGVLALKPSPVMSLIAVISLAALTSIPSNWNRTGLASLTGRGNTLSLSAAPVVSTGFHSPGLNSTCPPLIFIPRPRNPPPRLASVPASNN